VPAIVIKPLKLRAPTHELLRVASLETPRRPFTERLHASTDNAEPSEMPMLCSSREETHQDVEQPTVGAWLRRRPPSNNRRHKPTSPEYRPGKPGQSKRQGKLGKRFCCYSWEFSPCWGGVKIVFPLLFECSWC